jgi:HlyD family secretion protein
MPKRKILFWSAAGLAAVAAIAATLVSRIPAQDAARAAANEDEKRWQAVAPGQVEPRSGEITIAAPVLGLISQVLVKPNDTVFAGEALVRLDDDEARARVASAEAQVAMRRRARNDQSASSRAADRRRAEDAAADAERAVVDARAALDQAAAARRAGKGSQADLEAARGALARTQDRLKQQRAELRRVEADAPLPSQTEGQLNLARTELAVAEVAMEKMTIRAPIAGTVLQVNAKPGELAAASAAQPLVLLGDVSALRVRAEVDEHDLGEIKIGQPAVVRAEALRGREFAGKVSAIAPVVQAGRINARGSRNLTDVNVVEVFVDLTEPGPLAVGMKADVYFRRDGAP